MIGRRSGDRNVVGGDRALLDRGYGFKRRGDRWLPDRWSIAPGSGSPTGIHLLNNLTSYWKLDEASGARVNSQGNVALNLTLLGGSDEGNAPGIINSGHFTSGSLANVLGAPDSASWNFAGDLTVSGWLKYNAPGTGGSMIGTILTRWGSPGQMQWCLFWSGAGPQWQFSATSDGTAAGQKDAINTTPMVAGQWFFVIGWYDSTAHTLNCQVNNGTVNSVAFTGPIFHAAQPTLAHVFTADNVSTYYYTNSVIDEVGIWTRVLTASERTALYNGGAGLPFSSFTA